MVRKKESLGEVLSGDRLTNALYDLKFREEKVVEILCHKKLERDKIAKFRHAIINEYYFQMYCDDLPLWGFIGKAEDESWAFHEKGPKYYLFTHVQFNALYDGDQIIEISAFSDPSHVVDITKTWRLVLNSLILSSGMQLPCRLRTECTDIQGLPYCQHTSGYIGFHSLTHL